MLYYLLLRKCNETIRRCGRSPALPFFIMEDRINNMKRINIVLYEDFTALDVFGPVEVLGNIPDYELHYVSISGGIVKNKQGICIVTEVMKDASESEIVLITGGFGSREVINDSVFIGYLENLMKKSRFILCVCTGSALAAKTGLLDGKNATSNKTAFEWVKSIRPEIEWNRRARWVKDGNIYTSAGVSAGTDMALGFVCNQFGTSIADEICNKMEYHWNRDADHDDF